MRQKILVTGGSGFLGSALKKQLPDAVYLSSADYDLRSRTEAEAAFQKYRPELVFHLAAEVGGVLKNANQNAELFASNVQINTNVLNAAQQFGTSKLIGILSACAFRFFPDRASSEEDLHAGLPYEGNLGYGLSKRMLDLHVKMIAKQNGFSYTTLTPVTMYGPHDNWNLESGHVTASLIHRLYTAKREKKPFTVWGSGRAVRQFIFVEDIARLLVQCLNGASGPETTIVTPDSGMTIKELAETIAEAFQYKGEILFDRTKPEGELVRRLESKTFKKQFSDFKFTPLKQGIQKTVEWFEKHYDEICAAKGKS